MTKKIIKSLFDILILVTCLFVLGMLVWIFIASIRTWIPLFTGAIKIEEKGFWAGIFLAIFSGLMYFTEEWIHVFAKTYKSLFTKTKTK